MRNSPVHALRFLFLDREYDNYTYEISNRGEMEQSLAGVLSTDVASVHFFVEELEDDWGFRQELNRRLKRRWDRRHALYGRRAGWYASVRSCRPAVTVEVGVHDDFGSSVILHALERNGDTGRLIGIDIDPTSGWRVPTRLRANYDFTYEQNRSYSFWSEQVVRHFFGGAGIGPSLPSRAPNPAG